MRYDLRSSARYKKDLKAAIRRGYDMSIMDTAVGILLSGEPLPEKYYDHALTGNWIGHRECHLTPDWLLIYRIEKENLILVLTRTGTHSDLF